MWIEPIGRENRFSNSKRIDPEKLKTTKTIKSRDSREESKTSKYKNSDSKQEDEVGCNDWDTGMALLQAYKDLDSKSIEKKKKRKYKNKFFHVKRISFMLFTCFIVNDNNKAQVYILC